MRVSSSVKTNFVMVAGEERLGRLVIYRFAGGHGKPTASTGFYRLFNEVAERCTSYLHRMRPLCRKKRSQLALHELVTPHALFLVFDTVKDEIGAADDLLEIECSDTGPDLPGYMPPVGQGRAMLATFG